MPTERLEEEQTAHKSLFFFFSSYSDMFQIIRCYYEPCVSILKSTWVIQEDSDVKYTDKFICERLKRRK